MHRERSTTARVGLRRYTPDPRRPTTVMSFSVQLFASADCPTSTIFLRGGRVRTCARTRSSPCEPRPSRWDFFLEEAQNVAVCDRALHEQKKSLDGRRLVDTIFYCGTLVRTDSGATRITCKSVSAKILSVRNRRQRDRASSLTDTTLLHEVSPRLGILKPEESVAILKCERQ